MKLVLESRHLFDGSLHTVAQSATHHHAADDLTHHRHLSDTGAPASIAHDQTASAGASRSDDLNLAALAPNPDATEILFVDPRVADWQSLVAGVNPDTQVVLINPGRDAIDQVTQALQGRQNLTSIQFLTYGQSGQIDLGNAPITAASLTSRAAEVASWGDHLAQGADIEFWGCDVGQGSAGQGFVQTVHNLTGATVGASTDLTGSAALGGNWTLEDTTGTLTTGAVFSTQAMADYQGVLDTADPIVTLTPGTGSLTSTDTSGNVLAGDTFTETLTFQNGSSTIAGYGPIVNLYVPTASGDAETAMLDPTLGANAITYLGQAVQYTAYTLVADPDGSGAVGHMDPNNLTNGKPTFVDAPAGSSYKAGDTVYEIVLPFGSFTPGEPAASITLNFKMDATGAGDSELTSASTKTLDIIAVPYFEFGDSATGSTSSPNGVAVTSHTNVTPFLVTEKADLPEDETATGPDNSFDYEIDVVVAPDIAAADAAQGVDFTFTLPGSVERTGDDITVTGDGTTFTYASDGAPSDSNTTSPGDTVTVKFATLGSTGGDSEVVVDIPVFVPDKDASGNTILTSAPDNNFVLNGQTIDGTGQAYQKTIAINPAYTYTGSWTPDSGLASGTEENVGFSGTAPLVEFVAKALAIQVTDSTGGSASVDGTIAPGEIDITETIHFQVSDYFDLNNLVIQDVIGDGFALDPNALSASLQVQDANSDHTGDTVGSSNSGNFGTLSSAPAEGGATVSTAGSLWSATANSDGTTTMQFMVGALLADIAGGSVLQGGSGGSTQGTITFTVNAQNAYSAGGSNAGRYMLEGDTVTNGVTTTGTSATIVAGTLLDPGVNLGDTVADNSTLTDDVPDNTLALEITSVNGAAPVLDSNGDVDIQPGDTVTYQLVYTMTASDDFGNDTSDHGLSLSAYLPLPIFDAGSLTQTTGTPGTGQFSVTSSDSSIASYFSSNAPTASFSGTADGGAANSVTFNLGNHDGTANSANQTITVQFTVTATNNAFANGLFLTNLAASSDFDAHNVSALIPADAIVKIHVLEPEVLTKTGIVSVVGDTDGAKSGIGYGVDGDDTDTTVGGTTPWETGTNPTTVYNAAGTDPNSGLFQSGQTAANALNTGDLNASGADASDTARVVTTVENTGDFPAYGVQVKGTSPLAVVDTSGTGGFNSFNIYTPAGQAIFNSHTGVENGSTYQFFSSTGAVLTTLAQVEAAYFSAGGVQIKTNADAITNGVATGGLAPGAAYFIAYDVQLPAAGSLQLGTSFQAGSQVVNWWNTPADNDVSNTSTGFVGVADDGTTPVAPGDTPGDLSDTATIGTALPGVGKAITGDNDNDTTTEVAITATTNGTVVPGETITYTVTLTVPEGEVADATITDSLPPGMTLVGNATVDFNGTDLTVGSLSTGATVANGGSATALSFSLGTIVNSNPDQAATITLSFEALVTAAPTSQEITNGFSNKAVLTSSNTGFPGSGIQSNAANATLDQPDIDESISVSPSGNVFSDETLTYTVTLSNSGNATAWNVIDDIDIPTGLTYVPGSLTGDGATNASNPAALVVGAAGNSIAVGGEETFTFQVTVDQNQPATEQLTVNTPSGAGSYTSMDTPVNGKAYGNTASNQVSVAAITPNIGIIGESNDTNGGGSGIYTTATDGVDATVGDIVRYSAYIQLPEGQNDATMTVDLPPGMTFDETAGSITVMLVSPNGTGATDTSITGSGGSLQQGYTGYSSATSPGTFDPTKAVATFQLAINGSDVVVNGNQVTFDLGTMRDNQGSSASDYVVVQFNAIVANTSGNHGQSAGNETQLTATANYNGGTNSGPATVTVEEPDLTLTKGIDTAAPDGGIQYDTNGDGGADVTYIETISNSGTATAYNVALNDPLAANNVSLSSFSDTGALDVSVTGGGTDVTATGDLAAGGVETITYTVHVSQVADGVASTTASVTYTSLSNAAGGASGETLAGTETGASGATTGAPGSRDGSGGVNDYDAQVALGLGVVSGQVWNDIGPDQATEGETGSDDSGLGGVSVTGTDTYADGTGNATFTQTVTTAGDGTYLMLTPNGTDIVTLPNPGSTGTGTTGVASNETLSYNNGQALGGAADSGAVTVVSGTGTAPETGTETTVDFSYQTPDTAPTISWPQNGSGGATYTEGGSAVALSAGGSTVSDTQIDEILGGTGASGSGDYAGTTLTIQRYDNSGDTDATSTDVFSMLGTGPFVLSGGNLTENGTTIGSYTESNGKLAITFGAGVAGSTVEAVMNNIAYASTATNTIAPGIQIGMTLNDDNANDHQGTGGDMTSAAVFVTVNLIPAGNTVIYTEPNNGTPSGGESPAQQAAQYLAPSLNLASTTGELASATVSITGPGGGPAPAEDQLFVDLPPSAIPDLTVTYANGVLTISATSGSASTSEFQAALQAVKYYDNSDQPTGVTSGTDASQDRIATFTVTDTDGNSAIATTTGIRVVATDDSPVLNDTPVSLNDATEDGGAPVDGVTTGTLVSALTGNGNVTDTDGNDAHNGSAPGDAGIAITGADTSEGNWYYSTNGGTTWTEFAGTTSTGTVLPAISATNALHLVADGNTMIYFQPTVANWNGVVPNALTFRAWDQFDGATNGSLSALPTDSALGAGTNTDASAYSSTTDTIPLTVDAVNDAPVATGSASYTEAEDPTNPPVETVSDLFNPSFSDTADQQQSVSNPDGSVANTLAGIAVTGNAATAAQGTWQYSTDGGTTWVAIPASVSDGNSLVLSASTDLRFVPAANYNGEPGALSARLIDSSTVVVAGTVTGQDLATGGAVAISGVDVTDNGGTTAVSAAAVPLDITVTAVNDAPIASGSASLPPPQVSANDNPPGETVSDLFNPSFSDATDQQQSTSNPDGSVANTLAGVAITGNAATAGQGSWQYSTDGGTSWVSIPTTGLGDTSATIIPASAELRFLPAANFNGTPGDLTVRLIDNSSDTISGAETGVDVTANGGITAISAGTVDLSTSITAAAPPVLAPPPPPAEPVLSGNPDTPSDPTPPSETPLTNPFLPQAQNGILNNPSIPQITLIGSVGNKFIIEQQQATIPLPGNLFQDTIEGAELTYQARSPDGGPLPPWLDFDPRNLTFKGRPPVDSHGSVEIEIIATDQFGNEASSSFRILVGRPVGDLSNLIDQQHLGLHGAPGETPVGHGHRASDQQGSLEPAHHKPVHLANADTGQGGVVDLFASIARPAPAAAHGRAGFSAQLRDAGRNGQFAQARQLLNSIVPVKPAKPAA
jgi:fimbrial isopeptide formation D2 family protein/uncharacterized repeat protein (TIGR01451 family)